MKIDIRFDGGIELEKALRALPAEISRPIQLHALMKAAEPIRAEAAALAPVGEGPGPHLADHIVISAISETRLAARGRETETVVAVGPSRKHFYGRFQELAAEYGGVHHRAQPFMRPAFDIQAPTSLDILADELWWALRHGVDKYV